jgi:hypothetical protein
VADEPDRPSAARRELIPHPHLPGSASAGDLVHITPFRYAEPLRDPAALLRWLGATQFRLGIDAGDLLVIKERISRPWTFGVPPSPCTCPPPGTCRPALVARPAGTGSRSITPQ